MFDQFVMVSQLLTSPWQTISFSYKIHTFIFAEYGKLKTEILVVLVATKVELNWLEPLKVTDWPFKNSSVSFASWKHIAITLSGPKSPEKIIPYKTSFVQATIQRKQYL